MNVQDFLTKKEKKSSITMVTCYDFWSAQILDKTDIDCILIGDSLSQIMLGHDSTLKADIDIMALHIQSVSRGASSKFLIGDMPFLSVRKDLNHAMDCVEKLMKAGAHSVKIEGLKGHEQIISHIIDSGVPVMGHLGLTPQSVYHLGGYKVQGKTQEHYDFILQSAKKLEDLGCFSIVLECVPEQLASEISGKLKIPVIGIGAGKNVDGQVLVLQDLLGFSSHKPKFLRHFGNGKEFFQNAIKNYIESVRNKTYPDNEETYL